MREIIIDVVVVMMVVMLRCALRELFSFVSSREAELKREFPSFPSSSSLNFTRSHFWKSLLYLLEKRSRDQSRIITHRHHKINYKCYNIYIYIFFTYTFVI